MTGGSQAMSLTIKRVSPKNLSFSGYKPYNKSLQFNGCLKHLKEAQRSHARVHNSTSHSLGIHQPD